jgi:protein gp37
MGAPPDLTNKGATWQIVTGCQIVSPGCTNCYAMNSPARGCAIIRAAPA